VTFSLKEAYGKALHFYATQVAPIPPKSVREVLEKQGWQFKQTAIETTTVPPAPFAAYERLQAIKIEIKTQDGRDVYTSGLQTRRMYENALDRAARQVYLKPHI
jgi:hypothetical protein